MKSDTPSRRGPWLRLKALVLAVGLAIASFGAIALAPATPAGASAYGCSFWNTATVGGVRLASGQYCVLLAGQGTFVDYVKGGFVSASNVCNWRITAEFFDSNGRWYATYASPVRYTCSKTGTRYIYLRRYVKRGFMCSTLRQNGARITSVCHSIR
jgi:hypothetical protein